MNFYILIATKNSCLIEFEIADFFNEISRSTKVAYLAPVGLIYIFRNTLSIWLKTVTVLTFTASVPICEFYFYLIMHTVLLMY